MQIMCYSSLRCHGDLSVQEGINGGKAQQETLGGPTNIEIVRGSNSLSSRGEGGEGRART